jgi:hypothetical protein
LFSLLRHSRLRHRADGLLHGTGDGFADAEEGFFGDRELFVFRVCDASVVGDFIAACWDVDQAASADFRFYDPRGEEAGSVIDFYQFLDGFHAPELDLVASYAMNKYLSVLAKYGDYHSDGGVGGLVGAVNKVMFTLELNFKY